MNAAHLHLIFNHVPLFGVLAGIVLLSWGVVRQSPEVRLLARITFILTALFGLVVYVTGEGAEEVIEEMPGVLEHVIERHADAATIALIGVWLSGVLAAVGIAIDRSSDRVKRTVIGALFTVSLATIVMTGYAANLGGQIRHPEITGVSVERPR